MQSVRPDMPETIKVAFDARMIGHSGIGTQIQNVLSVLLKKKELHLILIGDEVKIHTHLPDFNGEILPFDASIYSIKEQFFFPSIPPDTILHIPHYNAPVLRLKNAIVTIHDLIHLQSEEFAKPHYRYYTLFLLGRIAKLATRITTVSETTRREFLMRFPRAEGKTSVVYNGVDKELFVPPSPARIRAFRKRYVLPDRFLLVVGIGKRHKNVDFVIRSLAPLWKSGKINMPLVLGGTGGGIPDYIKIEIEANEVSENVIALPRLEREELPLMYGAARLLIMPSLLEGFGFPVLEAMGSGTPVLCSNASSLPEIAGKAAHFFDPRNPADFGEKLLELLQSAELRKSYVARGLKRARSFSWKKYGDALMELYREMDLSRKSRV